MNKKAIINLGVAVALIGIVSFLLQAIISGGFMLQSLIGILTFALFITAVVLVIRNQRNAQGGFISFKEAFAIGFFGLLIGGIVSSIFTLLYVQFIDPEYVDRLVMTTLETTKGFMEGSMGEEQMMEILREQEKGMREGFTFFGLIKSLGIYLIVYAVIAAIVAAIMKKNPESTATESLDT
jgi:hypothetical protein